MFLSCNFRNAVIYCIITQLYLRHSEKYQTHLCKIELIISVLEVEAPIMLCTLRV
jgi:hypothetical protein